MRYWLLRRPPHYSDINPTFAGREWDYDMVLVNPRLRAGDYVYLLAAYNELYGWGYVIKKESYQDNELNGRAYKITVSRPVVQLLTSGDEIRNISQLASLFDTANNLIELTATQVDYLNQLLASKGVITPPSKVSDEAPPRPKPCSDFPRLQVSPDVEIWMRAVYERVRSGNTVDPQQLIVELWSQIPDFNYKAINNRLMRFGLEPTLLGILQIDPNTELCEQTDQVIRLIKERIQKEPKIERISAEEISEALEIPEPRIALIFALMDHLGDFWNGAGSNGNVPGYTTITIKDENVKRQYLKYEQLEPLLGRVAPIDEKPAVEAPAQPQFVHALLDWKFGERLEDALNWIDKLGAQDVLNYGAEELAKAVERFAVAPPIIRTDMQKLDESTVELEDLALERKTGATGHQCLIPIDGDVDWLEEIKMQTVPSDGHPLGFLDKTRHRIYVRLTVSPSDPEGTLTQKVNERVEAVKHYGDYVDSRVLEFNKQLAEKMTVDLNKRKTSLERASRETSATGLTTEHNPKHAETAIQIEQLVERLNSKFTQPLPYAEQLYEDVRALAEGDTQLDDEHAQLLIEKADDAIVEFGNTQHEKKVQLRKWKEQARLTLPPSTGEDFRKRAEEKLLKHLYPRNPTLRNVTLIAVGIVIIGLGAVVLWRFLKAPEPISPSANQLPSPLAASTPTPTPDAKPTETKETAAAPEEAPICIRQEESKSVLGGSLTIALGGISYDGSPLRHFVDVVLSSPGHQAVTFRRQENGNTLRYRGMFEVNVASTDTFSACFRARKIGKNPNR